MNATPTTGDPSASSVSRWPALAWTFALIVPNLIFFGWLFRSVQPVLPKAEHPHSVVLNALQILSEIYSFAGDAPSVYRMPFAFLMTGVACVFFRTRRGAGFASVTQFCFSPLGAAVIFGGLVLLFTGAFGAAFLGNVVRAGVGVMILTCAAGIGLRIFEFKLIGLDAKRFESPLERGVLASALGLGALSLGVFCAGSLGVMNAWIWRVMILGLIALNFKATRGLSADIIRACEQRAVNSTRFTFAAVAFLALFIAAHAPLIWNLPSEYDVLEYHLGAPAQYLRSGSIGFLNENIYATFPENGEMLYLLAMILAGDKLAGLPGAHVVLLGAWVLTVLGVYVLARRLERSFAESRDRVSSPGPIAAAGLFALVPMCSQLAADFYVEHFQALFHVSALVSACAFLSDFKIGRLFKAHAQSNAAGWTICAGAFAGMCCGAKYTGLIFTLAPLLIFLPGYCASFGAMFEALGALLRLGLPALLVFAPWLGRNGFVSGDPLHPLGLVLRRRLSGTHGVPDRIDHFEAAHRAGEISWAAFWNSLRQLMPGFREHFLDDIECGPQLCFFTVPGFASVANAETALIAFVFGADLLIWFFFSHRLNRFFYPNLAAVAALGGLGVARVWRVQPLRKVAAGLCCVAVLIFAPLQLGWVWLSSSREGVSGNGTWVDTAHAQFLDVPPMALTGALAQSQLPEGSRVLFIGEAETFYNARTPSYSVVFNESLLEKTLHKTQTTAEALSYLRAQGITHLYLNYSEWLRLDTSYALKISDENDRWKLARWDDDFGAAKYKSLKVFLSVRQFRKYAESWPDHMYPAYLKLSPDEYERFEDIFRNHTRLLWPAEPAALELREIIP